MIEHGGSFWRESLESKTKKQTNLKFSDNKAGDQSQIFNLGER